MWAVLRPWVFPSLRGQVALTQVMVGALIYLALANAVAPKDSPVVPIQTAEMSVISTLLLVFYFWPHIKIVSQCLILSLYVFVVAVVVQTGGVHATMLDWLGIIPSCTLLLGSLAALVWGACSLVILGVLAWWGEGAAFYDLTTVMAYAHWGELNLLAMLCAFTWFVILYEEINNQHVQALQAQKEVLLQTQTELTQAQSHKDEFIAVVSHELRTPLNAILGFAELMHEQLTQTARGIVHQIRESAQNLLQIISDILDFSQLQMQRVPLIYDRIQPHKILHNACRRFAEQAQRKGVLIQVQILPSLPEFIHADEFRLSQVLDQLLSNAVKFSDQGVITVIAGGDASHCWVDIADQGIGIDPQQLASIFTGFQHANVEVQHRYGGTGLGLAICQQLVELHHGQITVQSQLGQGATFRVTLPCEPPSSEPVTPVAAQGDHPVHPEQRSYRNGWGLLPLLGLQTSLQTYVVIMLGVSISMVYYGWSAPYEQAKWICLLLSLGYLIAVGWVWVVKTIDVSVTWMNCLSIAGIGALTVYAVGVLSPTASWLVVVVTSSLYLQNRRQIRWWFGLLVLSMVTLGELTAHGVLLNPNLSSSVDRLWSTSGHLSIMMLLIFLPLVHKFFRLRTQREMAQHNQALTQARQELLTQHQIKDQFIATITHALRTPLNFVIGFNDLLRDEIKEHHAQKELLAMQELVAQSAQHLLTVIDDILDYSQLMTGQVNLKHEIFELPKVITHVFQMFEATQNRPQVTLSLHLDSLPQWVYGDVQRLRQILVNLLSNAMKFTAQGEVALSVGVNEGDIVFEVRDTGVGIAEEKIDQMFERFEQANQRKNRRQGHGLGLSITRRLIQAQNGWIRVQSELGRGTRFTFSLSLEQAPAPQPHAPVRLAAPSAPGQACILVVDDQPLNRTLVKAVLNKVWPDIQIIEAVDGLHAIEQVQAHEIHLILMDMLMPEMDGVSATLKIRQELPHPISSLPIIGLTANANESTRQQCLQAGMNEIIYKPFNRDELIQCIEMWLGGES